MKADKPLRFDVDALRKAWGEKTFARGEAYFRDGEVQILAIEQGRVLAQVSGTEDYRTEVAGGGRTLGGECTCIAFGQWGFCKHMVAAALAANALSGDPEAEAGGALRRIRDHLKGKGVDALVEMVVGLAERDAVLFRKLDTNAALAGADDATAAAHLRKAIDRATRVGRSLDHDEADAWADEIATVLSAVADLALARRHALALELAMRAIERLHTALEKIDDSDGFCTGLLERARDIHRAAAREVRPDPVALARDLFAREMNTDADTFYRAAHLYDDALGEKGLAEYRRLAVAAWEKLPPRRRNQSWTELDGERQRLMAILDNFAERDGDLEARIALRVKNLPTPGSYLDLARFCLAHGRGEDALRWAQEGLWQFEDGRADKALVLFVAERLAEAGGKAEAEAQLQNLFEQEPTLEIYDRLCKLGGEAARERMQALLRERLDSAKGPSRDRPAGLLVEVLTREAAHDEAWEVVRRHGASMRVKETLARASEATRPGEAVAVYAERVDDLANFGSGESYAQAAKLVARLAALQSETEQAAYVRALRERFKRKRNFMKLLG